MFGIQVVFDKEAMSLWRRQTEAQEKIAASLSGLAVDVKLIRQALCGILPSEATGIIVVDSGKETSMTQKCKCKVVKATQGMKAAPKAGPSVKLAAGEFTLLDGGQGSFTTLGTDQAGNQVDISTVATETVVSDDPKLTVDAPAGMTVLIHAPSTGSGTANVTFTATWNDGSIGPFSFVAKVSYSGGAITGITVVQNP